MPDDTTSAGGDTTGAGSDGEGSDGSAGHDSHDAETAGSTPDGAHGPRKHPNHIFTWEAGDKVATEQVLGEAEIVAEGHAGAGEQVE